jgi:glycerophosphoryl diester phosphodiesterase
MIRVGMVALSYTATAVLIAQTPQTPFRTGVEIVELDVSVTRGGRPVLGLQAADFTLVDNGVMQDVQSVTLDRLQFQRFGRSSDTSRTGR